MLRKLMAFGLALTLALGMTGCKHKTAENEQAEEAAPVSFMTFNIRNSSAVEADGPNAWEFRKEAVAQMIWHECPDAIGLQEVLPDQLAYLDSVLEGYTRIGVGRDNGNDEGECMAIYFKKDRFALQHSATYWLSETPDTVSLGWDGACKRTATVVSLYDKVTRRPLLYVNTHLDHVGVAARTEGVKELAGIISSWAGEMEPAIILGGDMNSDICDSLFAPIFDMQMADARATAPETDTMLTYNAYGNGEQSRIDHFFVKNVTLKSFETLNGDYGVPFVSDHYPVKVVFDL